MRIDPRLLIEFAAVADEASFAKAAARLRIAQPWLSARIRRLEDLLGFALFTRTTRRVVLTARGAEFLVAAKAVADAVEAANALAMGLHQPKSKLLRVGAAPYSRPIHQRRMLIEQFAAQYPNVSLEIDIGWSLALLERLRQGSIDLTFMMGSFDEKEFEGITLRRFGLAITMSRSHPLASRSLITSADLAGQRVQVFTRGLNPRLWDELYKPLPAQSVRFVENPEMAEGPPEEIEDDLLAAFFDFEGDSPSLPSVVRIAFDHAPWLPFSLLRRHAALSPSAEAFWTAAKLAAA
ncbi:LysR family transcriptional regulator [Sphingobium sp. Cam5-1]|uniref:LysR family transcriptional regulator n=1 Tax=Sphingobium sp. Cam5-1 TaxID=2789327 RepID=UPI0018AD1540|nr:LysR family transcriptional regulator [Sphingobium sp. Cam5-1]QPI72093.1 LysR family transcriptional regulator [Sphingobium sp. Cam5-1]